MQHRLFFAKLTDKTKFKFQIQVVWNPIINAHIKRKIIALHVASYLDVYKNVSAFQLGKNDGNKPLSIAEEMHIKKAWLTKMIEDKLKEIKGGKVSFALAYLEDEIVGMICCGKEKPRFSPKKEISMGQFKRDVYIHFLTIKPIKHAFMGLDGRYFFHPQLQQKIAKQELSENTRLGIGKMLLTSTEQQFPNANCLTLDTRHVNLNARQFYEHMGFQLANVFDSDSTYYRGYEKPLPCLML